ncbi:muscle M-line assembly protein unc-89 isoform X2 [Orussus abietinus]|uniref:muscle M-line assembly protein unc-89 isoform X2 n=1 Tax=Orussus abietinus TaxID=222816 RepID=UPI000626BEFA|nr:muscle M-line assembly protein unc-89 isoform X2 [Orussus abietinus]
MSPRRTRRGGASLLDEMQTLGSTIETRTSRARKCQPTSIGGTDSMASLLGASIISPEKDPHDTIGGSKSRGKRNANRVFIDQNEIDCNLGMLKNGRRRVHKAASNAEDTPTFKSKSIKKKPPSKRLTRNKSLAKKLKYTSEKDVTEQSIQISNPEDTTVNDGSSVFLHSTQEDVAPLEMTTPRKLRGANKKAATIVTPESSPIMVNFTPHRSTKTPRKSPLNLGSPKTHFETPLGMSKTPRKLPITVNSPSTSDNSVMTTSSKETPKKQSQESDDNKLSNFVDGIGVNMRARKSPGKSKGSPVSSSKKKLLSPKFPKFPKIVLKLPKSKSPTFKQMRSSDKSNKSEKRQVRKAKSPKLTPIKNPESTLQLCDVCIPLSPMSKMAIASSKTPTVLLTNISYLKPDIQLKINSSMTNMKGLSETPVTTPVVSKLTPHGGDSPRRPKSMTKKRSPITDTGTPLRPVSSPRVHCSDYATSNSTSETKPELPHNVKRKVLELKQNSANPLMSSTPRDTIRRSLNLSSILGNTSPKRAGSLIQERETSSSQCIPTVVKDECTGIEHESEPLMKSFIFSSSSSTHSSKVSELNGTFDISKKVSPSPEKKGSKDDTYEITEPKTPSLQKKSKKRTLEEANLDISERETKRNCKVRFATLPDSTVGTSISQAIRTRVSTPGQKQVLKKKPSALNKWNTSITKSRESSSVKVKASDDSYLRRSSSMGNLSSTPLQLRRRSNSSDALSKTKKNDVKTPRTKLTKQNSLMLSDKKLERRIPARKAPNFAQIHQRKFEEMESVIDAKKRIQQRHVVLSGTSHTNLVNTKSKERLPLVSGSSQETRPTETTNGAFNRFGFKVRKNEAVNLVSKKPGFKSRESRKEEDRSLLKMVRTNRRFELMMKNRNLNT